MNAPTAHGSRLILRPTPGSRVLGWALAAFGLLFAYAGLSVGDVISGVTSMAAGGTFFAVTGASLASARVVADSKGFGIGISYRGAYRKTRSKQLESAPVREPGTQEWPSSFNGVTGDRSA
jgi:hypothetical protein